jgi:uncharacterized protein
LDFKSKKLHTLLELQNKLYICGKKMSKQLARDLKQIIINKLHKGKAIILIGARQIGKTTLLHEIISEYKDTLFIDSDDALVRQMLDRPTTEEIKSIIGNHKIVFIDEVQRISNIGLTAKIIVDQLKDVQLILSGSSAFDIKNNVNESLTGRKWEYIMFPIRWQELEGTLGYLKSMQQFENRIIYGMYPEIITHLGEEVERLKLLVDSYLYKDIFAFHNLKKPEVLEKLLTALALQIGSEVSINEISQLLRVDNKTILHYIEILTQAFVIFTLTGFSRNLRNELKLSKKIYFWDTGVRNTIIGNYNRLELRSDKGAIWENFLIAERMKTNRYFHPFRKSYFWRTTSQQEIDYVEIENELISAFEIKWSPDAKVKKLTAFKEAYNTDITYINTSNFKTFISN